MKANIKNVERLLRTAHAHYSQVRPDVEGGMVGIGQHGQSYLRRVCFHRATTGCKDEDHEKAVEAQVASRLGDLAPRFHKIFRGKNATSNFIPSIVSSSPSLAAKVLLI